MTIVLFLRTVIIQDTLENNKRDEQWKIFFPCEKQGFVELPR